MKFVGGKDFKVDVNKEYTEEDDKEFRKFVFNALCSVGCSPEYSK